MGWCYNPTRRVRFAATPPRSCTRLLHLAPRPSTHISHRFNGQRVGRRCCPPRRAKRCPRSRLYFCPYPLEYS
eukprot:994173-Prymnesium_polylepis.1